MDAHELSEYDEIREEITGGAGFAPWDGRRVPVTLLGGYLGAGKTTVLNEVLARTDRPIAVFVNDLGAVNIDASLIRRRHADTIDLTDGCVCCSLSGGLLEAFDDLRARAEPPEHVLIELSGVADPRRVAALANTPGYRLDGVVILVDADQFLELEADLGVGQVLRSQLDGSDLIVLTKLDLIDQATEVAVRTRIGALAPDTPIFEPAEASAIAGLLSLATRRDGGVTDLPSPSLFDAHRPSIIELPRPIEPAALGRIVEGLPPDTLRAKGVAVTPDGTRLLVQVVGRRREITQLPAAEDQPPTELVVISRAER